MKFHENPKEILGISINPMKFLNKILIFQSRSQAVLGGKSRGPRPLTPSAPPGPRADVFSGSVESETTGNTPWVSENGGGASAVRPDQDPDPRPAVCELCKS